MSKLKIAIESAVVRDGILYELIPNGFVGMKEVCAESVMADVNNFAPFCDVSNYLFDLDEYRKNIFPITTVSFTINSPEMEFCALDDIPLDESYIFPIFYLNKVELWESVQQFGFCLNERVVSDIKNGRCKILFSDTGEGQGDFENRGYSLALSISKKYNVPMSSFGIVDSNFDTHKSTSIKGFSVSTWEAANNVVQHENLINERMFELRNKASKKYYFTCLNRNPHLHRMAIVQKIQEKWYDRTLYSYMPPTTPSNTNELLEDVNNPSIPVEIDYDLKSTNPTWINTNVQSYINIVTESKFICNSQFLSEKIFKPVIYMQPFILVGPVHGLELFQSMGYKTFEPFIDESYDYEVNPKKRFALIEKEIDRLYNLGDIELIKMSYNLMPILQHNVNNMRYRQSNQIQTYNLIQELKLWIMGN
jgi:peptidoglycan/xylan/chitin deacetylase (PgdA/CDA1 family)